MKSKHSVIITLVCSVHIFGLYFNLGEASYYILDLFGFSVILHEILNRKNRLHINDQKFRKPLILLFFAILISAVSCYVFHGQNIISTVLAMRYFVYLGIYFQLKGLSLDKGWLEKFIVISSIVYMSVFLIQVLIFPSQIVNIGRIDGLDRGLLRFRIEGAGFLMLAGFLALNRFLITKTKKYLLFYVLCYFFLFLLGFRTLLITAMVSSLFIVYKLAKNPVLFFRNIIVFSFVLYGIYILPIVQDYFSDISAQTEKQLEMGDEYIQFQTFTFFLEKVNVNSLTLMFGNGFPQEDSHYGRLVLYEGAEKNGYIFADLGLIGFGFIYGILSLICLLYIALKAVWSKVLTEDVYLKAYFLYLILSSVTTVEIYRVGIFGTFALVLYMIDLSRKSRINLQKFYENKNSYVSLCK